jgi:hypothetical protein
MAVMYAYPRHYGQQVVYPDLVLIVFFSGLSLLAAGCGAFVTTTSTSATSPTVNSLSISQQPANETVNQSDAATFSVTATGAPPLHYQWQRNGSAIQGAAQASYTTPDTTAADSGALFRVQVTDSNGTILSRAATLTVTAPAPAQLRASPASLDFGNVPVGTAVTRQITLATSGSSDIVLTKIGIAGPGFNVSGASTGVSQAPGQTTTLQATFAPASSGSVTGGITISSDASNPITTIQLSGSGVEPTSHFVSLQMAIPSPGDAVGYNVYRATTHGGPYAKLTQSVTSAATYTDTTVKGGDTYYYVATSVDANNTESLPSDEASATVPFD